MRTRTSHTRHGQRGVVILVLILIVMSASSYVVLKALNENSARDARRSFESTRVLSEAKRALIGYAVAYADGTHALGKGPGHLPCPDFSPTGPVGISDTAGTCASTSGNETGRFPWKSLGLSELKDGSGAPIWYAVSDNHRSQSSPPLNSETLGTLAVDGKSDIVAVLIAPGAPLAGQERPSGNQYSPSAFLEDENASTGDSIFVSAIPDPDGSVFNDVVVALTRAELMAAVEKTVIAEVANALDNYFNDPDGDDLALADPDCVLDPDCDDGYPWLSNFDPTAVTYPGTVGTTFGHIPIVERGVAFSADFFANWSISTDGDFSSDGATPPDESCVRSNVCSQSFVPSSWLLALVDPVLQLIQAIFPWVTLVNVSETFSSNVTGTNVGDWSQGECTLNDPTAFVCTATYDFTAEYSIWTLPLFSAQIQRVYQFEFVSNTRLWPPSSEVSVPPSRRTIAVQQSGNWPGIEEGVITVTDYDMEPSKSERGSATLRFSSISIGDNVNLTEVPFDLEISHDATISHATSPGELPNWLLSNNWHRQIIVQYASAERPGDSFATCIQDASCLTVNIGRPGETPLPDGTVRGVVLASGQRLPLANANPRPSTQRTDYFEDDNSSADELFDLKQTSELFNDQIVTLPLNR